MDEPKDAMTFASSSSSVAAHSVAMNSPGNEPLVPTATVSPFSSPASSKYRTSSAAKLGSSAVRLASSMPGVVVSGVHSGPISPVWFRSMSSMAIPSRTTTSFRISSPRCMRSAAARCTSAQAAGSRWRVSHVAEKPVRPITSASAR